MHSMRKNSTIYNFLEDTGVTSQFSKPSVRHFEDFIHAAVSKGFLGKTTEVEAVSLTHRTSFSRFLSEGKWDEALLDKKIKETIVDNLVERSEVVFVSVDDTVNCKKRPSLQAVNPMQATGYYHSNLEGRRVWGHNVQAMMLTSGDLSLNYDLRLCSKESMNKIDYVVNTASSLPMLETKCYALFDSWYSCAKVVDAFESRGYYCIGGLKTNRIIQPKGIRISIKEFAKHIEKGDVHLVTVNKSEYYVYRYEGKLNGIGNAVVLISWPKKGFKDSNKIRAFFCTDTEITVEEILEYYKKRWKIETFFQDQKGNLGFSTYQIRSRRGIERYFLLVSYVHLFCTLKDGKQFGQGLRDIRKRIDDQWIKHVYNCGKRNIPFEHIRSLYAC